MNNLVKKVLPTLLIAFGAFFSFGSAWADSSDFPSKPITIIVAYSAGGGTDTTARILAPYLEDVLGVPVNVVNYPGGAGWVGWTKLANSQSDGYTIGFLNSPNIASGLVNPHMQRLVTLDSFDMIGNVASDPGAIVIRKNETRFNNFKELLDYARQHELTTTATGVGGDDHLVTLELNKKLDTKFRAIQFESTADSRAAFLGSHVDVLVTSVGEIYTLHKNDQVNVVAVTAEQRSPFLPDVPTVEQVTGKNVISASTRGLAAPAGVPPERLEILREALAKAMQKPGYIKQMNKAGIGFVYKNGKQYRELLENDVSDVKSMKDLLGWS